MTKGGYISESFPVAMLLVGLDPASRQQIVHAAGLKHWATTFFDQQEYPSASRRPSFRSHLSPSTFSAAFIDFDASPEDAAETARYLRKTAPAGITLIAVASERAPALMLMAMRAGCTEFMEKKMVSSDLPDLMDRLETLSIKTEREVAAQGTILSLMGVKGGIGATSVAVQLAVTLSKAYGKRTLLVDAHPALGHACIYLGLDATTSHFADVVNNVNRLDSELLRGLVAPHASGLGVLSSPDKSVDGSMWEHSSLVRALTFLRSEYEYIVVDCPIDMLEVSEAVMEKSSLVYLVTAPEIGAIRDLSRHVDRLSLIDSATDKLRVVLNRCAPQFAANAERIERAIKLPIVVKLPNSHAEIARAQNLGETITPEGGSEFATQTRKWAASLLGVAPPAATAKKKGALSWFSPGSASASSPVQEA